MKAIKIIGFIFIVVMGILQLFPSELPVSTKDNPNDFLANNDVPDSIATILKNGCYDCHSNDTSYPWYSYVKPTAWLVSRDTKVGREHLNFSDWETLPIRKKLKVLNETAELVESKEMPFPPYMLIHKEARLSKEERQKLIQWTEDFGASLLQ